MVRGAGELGHCGQEGCSPFSSGSAATGLTPVTTTIARPSPFKCLHSTEPAIELLQRNVLLFFLLHHFLTSFQAPSSASTGRASSTHELHAQTPAACLLGQLRARHGSGEQEGTAPGGRALPRGARSSGRGCPAPPPLSPAGSSGSSPGRAPLPAPRGAALTGQNGLAAAAQRQPGEGQDGGEGGRLHRQRPPGRAALAGGSPGSPGVAGGREERKVREAEALQHVSCKCAPARCRVADEGSYYQPCDRKG